MAKELKCDFYLGDRLPGDIKKLDSSLLMGFRGDLKNSWLFGNLYWQCGATLLVFKPYNKFIMTGDPSCMSNWIILILARVLHKNTYLWSHGWYGRESKIKKFIKKIFFHLGTHIFLYGDHARELMIKEGFSSNKLSCLYNSLDYDQQIYFRKELKQTLIYQDHFDNNNRNLIFISRLISAKRIDLLLRALAKLKNDSQEFNLTIVGNGETKEELILLSNLLKLERNIWFYGESYDEEEIAKLMFNADLCVSPGNVGLTAIHALSYGTPVITHNNYAYQGPEFESIHEGVTGAFFEYENYNSLAETINIWFKVIGDREAVREKCYKVIDEKYNPYYQIEILKKLVL